MQRGFTLIELMIVLCIIAILAVITAGAFNKHPANTPVEVVPDHPDFKTCEFAGLDPLDRTVFKCPDGKFYTN
jgi:prepilin-type N-terminal cleavage/methylation domain-containing protein